tara:strand:+ start:182 stop:391 length:210 start_codon:yes stop_codon:yes gene_type:complete
MLINKITQKMTKKEKKELLEALEILTEKKKNETDFIEEMEIAGEIHAIEMKLNGIKPTDSAIDCEGCGS